MACSPALASEWRESPELAAVFSKTGQNGTFVVYNPDTDTLTGIDRQRAEAAFLPASTFKIPHALIGLAVDAVADVDEILPYGGEPQPFTAWERDMSLREAIKVSNVPIFQELARRIGLESMREHLALLEYGNQDTGEVVDRFWLDGPLRISPVEQAVFLSRLARYDLPLPDAVHVAVREISLVEKTPEWSLYAKTGTDMHNAVGWWVGWVEKDDQVYAFALNISLSLDANLAERIELGKTCLRALGILN